MKVAYTPFGIVLSLLMGQVGKKIFDVIWGRGFAALTGSWPGEERPEPE
jgi:hypothetical protein